MTANQNRHSDSTPVQQRETTPFGIPLITILLLCLTPACGDDTATIRMQRPLEVLLYSAIMETPNRTFGSMLNGHRIEVTLLKRGSAACENPVICFTQNKADESSWKALRNTC